MNKLVAMNILNIQSLTATLASMGFADDIGYKLLRQVCYRPEKFTLEERILKGKDLLTCTLFFEKKNEAYHCDYYEVSLLKETDITGSVQSINILELDRRMADINWSEGKKVITPFNLDDESSWEREKAIENVVLDLSSLSATEEGKYLAGYLKLKHWCGVASLSAIYNLNALRARYEINQRFYFFDGQGISVEEAYRFLMNRWMEKKLQAKRKPNTGDGPEGSLNESANQNGHGLRKRKKDKSKMKK